MLTRMSASLVKTLDEMFERQLHLDCSAHASCRDLISAADLITNAIGMLPSHMSPFIDSPKLNEDCMPSQVTVQAIQQGYDKAIKLRVGNGPKGRVGWNEFFGMVKELIIELK